MQKISKQSTFIDHRRKGESLWLKKLIKLNKYNIFNIGNKISKKKVLGLTEIKI